MAQLRVLGIVGAGQMGGGIAQVAAQAEIDVRLVDASEDAARAGLAAIEKQLDARVSKRKLDPEQRDAILTRIRPGARLELLADADFVIEAATEDVEVKRGVFESADRIAPPHAVLATNTSAIPITKLAAHTRRPEQVI